MLSEKAEEVLEALWIQTVENKEKTVDLSSICVSDSDETLKELQDKKLIKQGKNGFRLAGDGETAARDVVRRHRLAERMLTDVLNIKDASVHESACKFEHVLHKGVDEAICTMLGHPKTCPHGTPIPPGKCCLKKAKASDVRVVGALAELKAGEKGKIAYIQASSRENLNKMMAMGVLPGNTIQLLQNFPSYLFKVGNSQFAVDSLIAREIFVRIEH